MSKSPFIARILPFIILGVSIVALAFGLMVFAYIIILGGMIGIILYVINQIQRYFFPEKKPTIKKTIFTGRIIDASHWRRRK